MLSMWLIFINIKRLLMSFSLSLRTIILYLFLFSLILPFSVFAQNTVIKGKVIDQEGSPLQSVSVNVKGSTSGTTTNVEGTFSLSINRKGRIVLIFSSVGFTDKEFVLGNSNEVNIQLEKSDQSLNAVVVVGYGSQKRKDITGSVVSVDKQRLEDMPNTNFAQALEGSLAGVSVTTNGGGAEGNNISILIRGQKSIKANML